MIFAPCFVLLVVYGQPKLATLLFVLAGVTDGLDGLIARTLKQRTVLGSFLDPMADKILLTASFVTLTIPHMAIPIHIPAWLTITSISRDLLIAISVLVIHLQTGHTQFPPSWLGKCTTAAQLTTVGLCMLANFTPVIGPAIFMPVVFLTLLVTVVSGLHYFYRSVRIINSYQRAEAGNGKSRRQDL